MKLTIDYPFLTRGRPRRCDEAKDIYLTMRADIEVPDISLSEMETVFETPKHEFNSNKPFVGRRVDERACLKSYDGRLFRKVSMPLGASWYQRSFSGEPHPIGKIEFGSDLNLGLSHREGLNPITAALRNQFDWMLESKSAVDSGEVTAWPRKAVKWLRIAQREATLFDEVVKEISDLDEDCTSRSLEMISAESKRLLMTKEGLWIACGPPCWVVDLKHGAAKDEFTLYLGVLPTHLDAKLERRYFSLDRLDDAKAYAKWCAGTGNRERCQYFHREASSQVEVSGSPLLSFDQDNYDLDRLSLLFAMESARRIRSRPDSEDLLDDRLRQAVVTGYAAVAGTNHVLGEFAEISHLAHELADAWQTLKMPAAYISTGTSRAAFGPPAANRLRSLADQRDITVDISPITIASGGMRI